MLVIPVNGIEAGGGQRAASIITPVAVEAAEPGQKFGSQVSVPRECVWIIGGRCEAALRYDLAVQPGIGIILDLHQADATVAGCDILMPLAFLPGDGQQKVSRKLVEISRSVQSAADLGLAWIVASVIRALLAIS